MTARKALIVSVLLCTVILLILLQGVMNTTMTEHKRRAMLKSATDALSDVDKSLCKEIDDNVLRSTARNQHLVHTVVRPATPVNPHDVTFATQLSLERIDMLMLLLKHWQGPLSVAVYCSREEAHNFLQTKLWENHNQISIHIVYKESNQEMESYYPINYLRNVAFTNSLTEYAFLCDVDFMPSEGLYDYLVKAVNTFLKDHVKRVLVVAAFEQKAAIQKFPENKQQLQILYKNRTVSQFHENFPPGHLQTNYELFFQQSFPYRVNWKRDYEPFMVVEQAFSNMTSVSLGMASTRLFTQQNSML